MKSTYRCKLEMYDSGIRRARVTMLEDHRHMGGRVGEVTFTSEVQSIDFANGVMVTKNSIYLFDPEDAG